MSLTNAAYIDQLYRNLLGRVPDAEGLGYFQGLLDTRFATRAQVAATLYNSPEFQSTPLAPLVRLYNAAFGRTIDDEGLPFWGHIAREGASMGQIAAQFVASPEFTSRYGNALTDAAFVSAVYQNVLQRAPEAAGLASWVGALQSYSRGEVLNAIAQSAENTAATAQAVQAVAAWWGIANRVPTPAELAAAPLAQTQLFTQVVQLADTPAPTLAPVISYSATRFTESLANDGTLANTITLTLANDTFTGANGSALAVKFVNVPSGLVASLTKTSDTTATLALTGAAKAHGTTNNVANVTVTFSATELASGKITTLQGANTPLAVGFFDVLATESSGLLTLAGPAPATVAGAAGLAINLASPNEANRLTLANKPLPLQSGTLASVNSADASGLAPGAKTGVLMVGNAAANTYTASPSGDTIAGGAGNDTLTGGAGADRYVFATAPADNGIDTIRNFTVGKGGDVLDLRALLNKTGTKSIATRLSDSTAAADYSNGDVLVVAGPVAGAADVAALFGPGKAFKAPTAAGKYVVITADIVGDASVWAVVNQTGTTTIDAAEVTQIATLVGVHNLQLVALDAGNVL